MTSTRIKMQGDAVGGTLQILVYGDVTPNAFFTGEVSARSVIDILSEHPNVATIEVRINSGGGSVFDGIAIFNQLRQHSARKVMFVDGIAASIASVVATAGDEIHMGTGSRMMIHNARSDRFGDKNDFAAASALLDSTDKQIAGFYMARTSKSESDTLAQMDAETWFTADEAVAEGLATGIVEQSDIAAHVDLSGYGYKRVPADVGGPNAIVNSAGIVQGWTDGPKITAPQPAHGETNMTPIVAKAAGLQESATEAEIAIQVTALAAKAARVDKAETASAASTAQLSALTAAIGEEGDAALGAVEAFKVSHASLDAANKKLADIEAKTETDRHTGLIKQGKAAGQLPKDLETLAASWSADQLEAFLKAAPKIVPVGQDVKPPADGDGPTEPVAVAYKGKAYSALSGPELVAFKKEDPALFAEAYDQFMESRGA